MNERENQDELIQRLKEQLKAVESTLGLISQANWITRARRLEQWAIDTQEENKELRHDNFNLRRENQKLSEQLETFEHYLDIYPIEYD